MSFIIIAEKINGSVPRTKEAIEARDADYIRQIAKAQADAGATYIDVNAGVEPSEEHEVMEWLIDLVQEVTDTPLCIDSADPQVMVDMMPKANAVGCLNSVNMEGNKCDVVFPAIAGTEWYVVALTCDEEGIPTDPQKKFEIAQKIIAKADEYGVDHEKILFDPLVTTLGTNQESFVQFTEATKLIKEAWPEVHITSGLSNISFGLPSRKTINMQFLALAMYDGMDSAIMDPTSRDMMGAMFATQALMNKDPYCKDYTMGFRNGLFGNKPQA
ncbi:MAG: methyltetrahydrofolate cobalamin methyltransferase [Eggerthellaceae bacterium]|nr:methyltetrahydrofolate cobalamin methyltransferase [Eggerthellaceae bacterium]